jgi:hypothetical protein
MITILEDLATDGFGTEFTPGPRDQPGTITCGSCGQHSDAASFVVAQVRRLEGASDPDEMALIAALRCPVCATGGALVLSYGPEVTETDAGILERLPDPPRHPAPSDAVPEPAEPAVDRH